MIVNITQGWTGQLGPFTLKTDGVIFPLTGLTLAIRFTDNQGNQFFGAGTVTDPTPSNGQVFYQPVANELLAVNSPYKSHWQVTDALGNHVYFPSGEGDTWVVWL